MSDIVERLRKPYGHDDCEDCWYSCAILTCDDGRKSNECDCGADTRNAERAEAAAEIEYLRAELEAAKRALQDFDKFNVSPMFDAKGSYSSRKCDELRALKVKHGAAIDAAMKASHED